MGVSEGVILIREIMYLIYEFTNRKKKDIKLTKEFPPVCNSLRKYSRDYDGTDNSLRDERSSSSFLISSRNLF